MSEKSTVNKLIIDVTYLAHWQGRLTGIPRVIEELSRRFAANAPATVFVVWDNATSVFYEVDIQKTFSDRGKKIHYIEHSENSSNPNYKIIYFTERVLRRLKNRHHVPIPKKLISVLSAGSPFHKAVITTGDTLLLLMGEWHNEKYKDSVKVYGESGARIIQVIYDVLPLVQPQYSGHSTTSQADYLSKLAPVFDHILCISKNTETDLIQWLKDRQLNVPDTSVFKLGDDIDTLEKSKPQSRQLTRHDIKGGDYVLCVGTIEARKNHTLLYYAYKLASARGVVLPKMIIVGRAGWLSGDIIEMIITDPETKDQMLLEHGISDQELVWLYDNALFTVYPSFYEGWGLPIAESLLRGVPCICSSTSSMPEIAGGIVDYFSPVSSDECLERIIELMNPKALNAAKKKIKAYKPTTWDETYEQVERIMEGHHA